MQKEKHCTSNEVQCFSLVENSGIEPVTSCMPCKRSPERYRNTSPRKSCVNGYHLALIRYGRQAAHYDTVFRKRFGPSVRKKRKIFIPTWVYSCCVRHEENRSESCRIVFPHMDVSCMGYGYCNILYGQIRQKSLIFFCLSVIPFVTRPPPLLSSPMVETPALKEIFRKTQRGDHF